MSFIEGGPSGSLLRVGVTTTTAQMECPALIRDYHRQPEAFLPSAALGLGVTRLLSNLGLKCELSKCLQGFSIGVRSVHPRELTVRLTTATPTWLVAVASAVVRTTPALQFTALHFRDLELFGQTPRFFKLCSLAGMCLT